MKISKKIIKTSFLNNKQLVQNFSYLSFIQVFGIAFPLITYPYLLKILGSELYGSLVFSQVVISYFSIIINFGFEASATKEISIYRFNKEKLSEIISSVLIIKFCLWLFSLFLLLFLLYNFDNYFDNKLLYLFSFLITFNDLLFPVWYFQGTEKMKFITIINLFVRCIFLIFIFLFVKNQSDYLLVPLFNGIGAFLGGVVGLIIMLLLDKNKFAFQSYNTIFFYIKDSFDIFLSNIVISIKDKCSVIFIGMFLGMQKVAIFDFGIKIMTVIIQLILVANNAIFPKMAREQNMIFLKKFIKISTFIVLILTLVVQLIIPYVLEFLSLDKSSNVNVIRVLLLAPLVMSVSFPIARNCIIALGYYKYTFRSVIVTTIGYLFLIGLGYMLNILDSVLVFAFITILTYLIELIYRLFICRKYKLLD